MNRVKISIILIILICFLCFVATIPVTCIFQTVTGISCPACGMTRAFLALFRLDFLEAIYQNILSIPLFFFLIIGIFMLCKDFIKNEFSFIPKVLTFFEKNWIAILILIFASFIINNIK